MREFEGVVFSEAKAKGGVFGASNGSSYSALHFSIVRILIVEANHELKLLALIAQFTGNVLSHAQLIGSVGIFKSRRFALSIGTSLAQCNFTNQTISTMNDSNYQSIGSFIVDYTQRLGRSLFDSVSIHANALIRRQINGQILRSTSGGHRFAGIKSDLAFSIRESRNRHVFLRHSTSGIGNGNFLNGVFEGFCRRNTIANEFISLSQSHSAVIRISRSSRSVSRLSHRDGGHAQQHHDCQQHCQNLLHGFILLKIEFVVLWNRPGAARRRYSLGFWGHRPGSGLTGPFCAGW